MKQSKSRWRSLFLSVRLNPDRDRDLIEALSHVPERERSATIRGALRKYLLGWQNQPARPVSTGENEHVTQSHTMSHKPIGQSHTSHTKYDNPADSLPVPTRDALTVEMTDDGGIARPAFLTKTVRDLNKDRDRQ